MCHYRYCLSLLREARKIPQGARNFAGVSRHIVAILEFVPLILIGGGSRSGKSRFALELALWVSDRPAFIATGEALDAEMEGRIARHREERDSRFTTLEAPIELADAVRQCSSRFSVAVVDCLTLWLSNVMLRDDLDLRARMEDLESSLAESPATLFVVTNEVGCGIVPENALARRFRDEAGFLNARCARIAQDVYWMVFGCPMRVK